MTAPSRAARRRLRAELKGRRRQQSRTRARLMAVRRRISRIKAALARPATSSRDRAVAYAKSFIGTVENPAGSNRGGVITTWQRALGDWLVGLAWCGTACAAWLRHAGVRGVDWRLASVANIEDDARAGRGPFTAWTTDASKVRPGDLVVLFGRGVHVEMVVEVAGGVVRTVGGNTSAGSSGSQSNGGGVFARTRALSDVHGFALVRYP